MYWSKVEREVAHAHHYQNTSMRFRFFRACAFRAKNPECYGFFWQCKRYKQKTQVFWILGFANVNGPTDTSMPEDTSCTIDAFNKSTDIHIICVDNLESQPFLEIICHAKKKKLEDRRSWYMLLINHKPRFCQIYPFSLFILNPDPQNAFLPFAKCLNCTSNCFNFDTFIHIPILIGVTRLQRISPEMFFLKKKWAK